MKESEEDLKEFWHKWIFPKLNIYDHENEELDKVIATIDFLNYEISMSVENEETTDMFNKYKSAYEKYLYLLGEAAFIEGFKHAKN